jgi:hypothetical protein
MLSIIAIVLQQYVKICALLNVSHDTYIIRVYEEEKDVGYVDVYNAILNAGFVGQLE